MPSPVNTAGPAERPRLRDVALPSEHGGWSLTLEPVLLGSIVAPSVAGFLLGIAALLAFLVRSPLKIVLVDRHRRRRLARTALAARVGVLELAAIAGLVTAAAAVSPDGFWWPLLAAAPLLATGLWYDARSRSRRLVPELAGSIGIGAIAAAIALAGGAGDRIAFGLWLVAGARAIAAIPFVRLQLRRKKAQPHRMATSDGAQALAIGVVGAGATLGAVSLPGVLAIAGLAIVHAAQSRTPPPRVPVLGAQQLVLGLAVVVTAALGAVAP